MLIKNFEVLASLPAQEEKKKAFTETHSRTEVRMNRRLTRYSIV
jgi:hypothetical protein